MRNYLRRRRVRLSPNLSLLFENAITVRHQVQEVLYWETSNDKAAEARMGEELGLYRTLLPARGELTGTLLVDGGSRDTGLAIGDALALNRSSIGLDIGGASIPARLAVADPDPAEPVKFLRFDLTREACRSLISGGPMSAWSVEQEKPLWQRLSPQTTGLLADDIQGNPWRAISLDPLSDMSSERDTDTTSYLQLSVTPANSCALGITGSS
jgi:hypothetical protein